MKLEAIELLVKEIWKLEGSLRRAKTKKNITSKEIVDLKKKIKLKKFTLAIVEEHIEQERFKEEHK